MRSHNKIKFIEKHLQEEYTVKALAGDASFRKYDRIHTNDKTYILMDSPPEHYSTEPFEKIAEFLLSHNISAPQIFHRDRTNGFLLLEDFGDTLMKDIIKTDRNKIYQLAIDLLIKLHNISYPDWLTDYRIENYLRELEIFTDYYIPLIHNRPLSASEKEHYLSLWYEVLVNMPDLGNTMVLKDYHVENLMYLDGKSGIEALGVLDFQDAVIGSPMYDLVSLLEDAREDVPFEFAKEMLDYYLSNVPDINAQDGYDVYDILGGQNHIRILGVFARKKIRDNSDNYLRYIPLVQKYLKKNLTNPALDKIKQWHDSMELY